MKKCNTKQMCLIVFAYNIHPAYPLVIGANRDEFFERPTSPLSWWKDHPHVLAGRDLQAGGTWMGITNTGRFAAITNFRDPSRVKPKAPSRGALVGNFLYSDTPAQTYLEQVRQSAEAYNGFNLIVKDGSGLFYYGNYQDRIQRLCAGVYGLSNHLLDTDWPKVKKARKGLTFLMEQDPVNEEAVFTLLADRQPAPDHLLPDTGIGLAWERLLSSVFIHSKTYGTRSSSVILIEKNKQIRFTERTFDIFGYCGRISETVIL
ncbi:MAG: NRDE family protein [Desulfobacteraceae bacterium]|nr:NRDE family protein [Desulfobacteraceae bacterium]